MTNRSSLFRALLVLATGLALTAGATARAQGDLVQPAAPVALEQDALQGYAYSQRSDFITAVSKAAARIDALIVPLTKRQKGGLAGGADAMTMEKLQSSRTELGHQIGRLEDVTPENWESQRNDALAALTQTQEAYEKAAREYNQT